MTFFDRGRQSEIEMRVALEKRQEEEEQEEKEREAGIEIATQRGDTINALLNHRWVSVAVLAFIFAVFFNNRTLVTMSAFLLIIVTAAWLWSRSSLVEVTYKRRFYHTHMFPGETTVVEIVVENKKWLPVTWLQAEDTWPRHFPPVRNDVLTESSGDPNVGILKNAYSLRWFERVRRHYEIKAVKRGVYELGPLTLLSGDPFSLFERQSIRDERKDFLVVYPEIKPLSELGFPLKDPFGDRRVERRLFEDPIRIIGIRDYQPQDSFRSVHWSATARTGKLQTKIFEPVRGANLVLAVNIASFEQHWRGFWPEMMEYALTVAASIAYWASEQGYGIGLVSNGALFRSDQAFRLLPSRNPQQIRHVLQALAGIKYFVTGEFGRFVLKESPHLPIGATMVMITPFISESIAISSIRLRNSGRRVVWVALGKNKPEEIQGITCHHLPIQIEEPEFDFDEVSTLQQEEEPRDIPRHETARQRYLRQKAREDLFRQEFEKIKQERERSYADSNR